MAKKKANLLVKEVAWSDGKPTMYQAHVEYVLPEGRTLRLFGSPKPNMEDTMEDLTIEVSNWEEAMHAFKEAVR